MSSIFLSHSSHDNEIAGQVKARLEQLGHRSIFLDFDPEQGIPAGRDWEKELYAKLRECRALIVLCSQASMASQWCFAELTHAKAQGKPVFPLKIDSSGVHPILANLQIVDAMEGWDQAYHRLAKGLLAAGLDPKNCFDWDGMRPPYPGLPAFQEQDAAIFFGRDKEIREGQALLNRLQQFGGSRLTLMLGASGSGKSSLMRAGLLPRLKRDQRWVVVEPFRPLNAPFDELATVLSKRLNQTSQVGKEAPTDVAHVRDRIRWEEHDGKKSVDVFLKLLKELRENAGSRDATVLLMIDQCEELLTVDDSREGDRFLAFLRAVLDCEDSRFLVLATLRSDFLGSFQDHPVMRGLRFGTFPVPQMAVDDFASVIEEPAKIAGLELGPGLVQAMINDTKTADALPLLAFTLRELYEGFGQDKRLALEDYRDQLGRLDGCIARAAEAVLNAKPLSESELSDLRAAFLSMVRVADNDQYAKQPVLWNHIPDSIREVLERFVTARLLISNGDEKGRIHEVAHEALFRAWPRLVDWLKDDRSFLVWQQRLRTVVAQYEETHKSADVLLRGFPLTEALEWLEKQPVSFSQRERQFVIASKKRRTRNWMVAIVVIVFSLIAIVLSFRLGGYSLDQAIFKVQSRLFVSIHIEPDMQPVSAGRFRQGDTHGRGQSNETPVHEVTIKSFAIGKYEVTFEEYDRFAIATGQPFPIDQGWGRGRRPVIMVSWEEAKAYAQWLSKETGKRYRLPTESEWEYAARSGGKDEIWAGTSNEQELTEYAVYKVNSKNHTAPVGPDQGRKPNAIGLYDMSGNVYEWVEDCEHGHYEHAPTDGMEASTGICEKRVIRGGSWGYMPESLRVSHRFGTDPSYKRYYIGFRLAQDLEP